jgi:LacI family transcriptional regulator
MDDVARRVGVAKSTVSLALNGKPGVSSELRQTILQVADELGYHLPPSRPSRGSSPHRTFAVVYHVVQASEAEPEGVALGYMRGIQSYARRHQISLTVLTDYPGGVVQRFSLQFLDNVDPSPEGLIVMGAGLKRSSPFIQWARERSVQVVALSRNWPDVPLSTVSQDHAEQARIAMEHLTKLGHRRIGFLARSVDQDCDWFETRLRCYREALKAVGEPFDETLVSIGVDGGQAATALLENRPDVTALFGIYDRVAVGALVAIQDLGIDIPHDLSIIGLDNAEQPPQRCPALTTVGFSHFGMGRSGARLLADQIEQPELSYARLILHSSLIERETCAVPRKAKEPLVFA